MDASAPPSYRRYSTRHGQAPASNELPPYSRRTRHSLAQPVQVARREPTEHVYKINDGKIVLKINSSAKSSKALPTFFEKEHITGQLEIAAGKGDSIQSIVITITGRVLTGSSSDDCFVFLNHVLPVWSKIQDLPRIPSDSEGTTGTKLQGDCVWPLSIALPRTVEVPTGSGESRFCRLPETFLERQTQVSVQYDFTLHISRGKLRSDSQIKTAFGYVPSIRPGPSSLLRHLRTSKGVRFPTPRLILRAGKFCGQCHVVLSIAQPLSFTRGTVIPCCLTIEGTDAADLDSLCRPSTIAVTLRRRVRFYNKTTYARSDVAWNETVEDVGSASWWPSRTVQSNTYTRELEGEIQLPKDLRPSSDMGHFSISYSVALNPFEAAGFQPDSGATLVSEPVEIATMHARGPRATPFAPPSYDNCAVNGRHADTHFQASVHGQIMVA
ncbi:hypothetical protein NP233_g8319 [Leucocoprinus birnbaumii]|uniref:Arrestin-like N-terminal domain-containing protein n=1 Tax=Leucocoprinus birnbaumii TaxID=56174 RepID=A0AAD5VQ63_9AGAR|nr:hypothetical protein NP233_g8319 [Leucocoprinus birnbaumii]